jgi:hypothetical protein
MPNACREARRSCVQLNDLIKGFAAARLQNIKENLGPFTRATPQALYWPSRNARTTIRVCGLLSPVALIAQPSMPCPLSASPGDRIAVPGPINPSQAQSGSGPLSAPCAPLASLPSLPLGRQHRGTAKPTGSCPTFLFTEYCVTFQNSFG